MNDDIKKYINQSVLCWLATSSSENIPNVSPKEVFAYYKENSIIIANIASPQSVKNIKENPNVCVSFIDILIQKGYQLKGTASLIHKRSLAFGEMNTILEEITQGKFPISSIIKIDVKTAKPIIAPKYILYPETTEGEQVENAKKRYGF